jgi:hypothetical protein
VDYLFASKSFCVISAAARYVGSCLRHGLEDLEVVAHEDIGAPGSCAGFSTILGTSGLPSTPGFRRLRHPVLVGTVKVRAETAIGFLAFEPNLGQVLPDEVARRDAPPLELGRCSDDAVPPQERHRIRLRQSMPLEIPDNLRA